MEARQVSGIGPVPCKYLLLGEAPGETEDILGEPFVGPSGDRLNRFLEDANLLRSEVRIDNVVPIRPPSNKTPTKKEIQLWSEHLTTQLTIVDPDVIVALGGVPLVALGITEKITKIHGRPRYMWLAGRARAVVPMFHPAFTLRSAKALLMAVADWRNMQKALVGLDKPRPACYNLVRRVKDVPDFGPVVALDFETTSGDWRTTKPIGIGLSDRPDSSVYIPVPAVEPHDNTHLMAVCRRLAALDKRVVVAHNAQFEYGILERVGWTPWVLHDTKLAAFLLGYTSTHLKDLSWEVLGIKQPRIEPLLKAYGSLASAPTQAVFDYAKYDADVTLQLWRVFEAELKEQGLWELYDTIERPLIPLLVDMTNAGWLIDGEELDQLTARFDDVLLRAQAQWAERAGAISISSPLQVAKLVFDGWGAPKGKGKKARSVDTNALDRVQAWLQHQKRMKELEALDALLEHRRATKHQGYLADIKRRMDSDGYIHPNWNQAGRMEEEENEEGLEAPATGRLSSSHPNGQNFPKRTSAGKALRNVVVAAPGSVLIEGDISGEEMRIAAFLSKDPYLTACFARTGDPHGELAGTLLSLLPRLRDTTLTASQITALRFVAKTCNLAGIYGCTAGKFYEIFVKLYPTLPVAVRRGLTKEVAHKLHAYLVETYKGLFAYWEEIDAALVRDGYTASLSGRRRWLPEITSALSRVRAEAIRKGRNHVVQGTGADVIKLGLVRVGEFLRDNAVEGRIIGAIHDSVLLRARAEHTAAGITAVKQVAEPARERWGLVLPVEVEVGPRWGQMKEAK